MTPEPRVAIVCPRRSDGGRRDVLWNFCRRWWQERFDWTIFEGHSTFGPFNRGAAINDAVFTAQLDHRFDVILIVDGDVVAEPEQVQAAVDLAHRTNRLTFAFTEYKALTEGMTMKVLDGYAGNWNSGVKMRMAAHVSSIVAVPVNLWKTTGGFEPRIEGWGHDDTVFAHVCRVLGGGVERVDGAVYHLEHPHTPERIQKGNPHLRASTALAKRYFAEMTPAAVERIIAEREGEGVVLAVLTHGRRECLDLVLPAALDKLKGLPIQRIIISDDSADIDYQAWLRWRFPDADLIFGQKKLGFAGNTRRLWEAALGSGQPWCLWLEDDFVVQRPVDLSAMAAVLRAHPELTQMVLRRQAWFPNEVAAGGIIEADPDAHTDRTDGVNSWVDHPGHWTNPYLISRADLARYEWPAAIGSEARFSRMVVAEGRHGAYWGPRTDPPLVEHIGERNGFGY